VEDVRAIAGVCENPGKASTRLVEPSTLSAETKQHHGDTIPASRVLKKALLCSSVIIFPGEHQRDFLLD